MLIEGNGHKEIIQPEPKLCPFKNGECIREKCTLYIELNQNKGGGLMQKIGTCSFNATVLILSEINQKTVNPQQRIQVPPGLLRS